MKTHYILDRSDRVVAVGGAWDAFAHENHAPKAAADHVVGRSLYEFIDGPSTRMFYEQLMFACRARSEQFSMLCRCDAPFVQRLYRMEVEPLDGGDLKISHQELDSVRFKPGNELIFLSQHRDANRCANCCKVKIGQEWHDTFLMFDHKDHTHAYNVCPDCRIKANMALHQVESPTDNVVAFPLQRSG